MLTLILVKKFASLLLIMAIGFISVKAKLFKSKDSSILSILMIYIICPCMILNSFQVERSSSIMFSFFIAVLVCLFVQVMFIILTMLLRKPLKLTEIEQASLEYVNAGNLIFPLVTAMFGDDMAIYALAYVCVFTFFQWSHLIILMKSGEKPSLKVIFTNINFICMFISFILFVFNIRFPSVIKTTLQSFTDMVGPIAMFITGMLLGEADFKSVFLNKRAYMIAFLRLIVYPVVALFFYKILGIESHLENGSEIMLITFMAACSCSASVVVSMAQLYGHDAEYASTINIITIILCIITLPLMVSLFQAI